MGFGHMRILRVLAAGVWINALWPVGFFLGLMVHCDFC